MFKKVCVIFVGYFYFEKKEEKDRIEHHERKPLNM